MSAITKNNFNNPVIPLGKSDKYVICSACKSQISQQYDACPACGNKTGITAKAL